MHACGGKQNRRIVFGHDRSAGDDFVPLCSSMSLSLGARVGKVKKAISRQTKRRSRSGRASVFPTRGFSAFRVKITGGVLRGRRGRADPIPRCSSIPARRSAVLNAVPVAIAASISRFRTMSSFSTTRTKRASSFRSVATMSIRVWVSSVRFV